MTSEKTVAALAAQAMRSLIDFPTEHCCTSAPPKTRRPESRKL
jgi:hypothetical protein